MTTDDRRNDIQRRPLFSDFTDYRIEAGVAIFRRRHPMEVVTHDGVRSIRTEARFAQPALEMRIRNAAKYPDVDISLELAALDELRRPRPD